MDKYELDELKKALKTEIKAEIKADLDLVWDDEDQNNKQRQFNKQINYNVLTKNSSRVRVRKLTPTAKPKLKARQRLMPA